MIFSSFCYIIQWKVEGNFSYTYWKNILKILYILQKFSIKVIVHLYKSLWFYDIRRSVSHILPQGYSHINFSWSLCFSCRFQAGNGNLKMFWIFEPFLIKVYTSFYFKFMFNHFIRDRYEEAVLLTLTFLKANGKEVNECNS